MSTRRSRCDERGSVTIELVVLAPVLLLMLGALILAGRVQTSAAGVEHAARVAAREASLARTANAARTAALAAAQRELVDSDCTTTDISVDAVGFTAPLGSDATVTVTVTCTIPLSDLAVPGLPGAHTMAGQATSPIDRYRSR